MKPSDGNDYQTLSVHNGDIMTVIGNSTCSASDFVAMLDGVPYVCSDTRPAAATMCRTNLDIANPYPCVEFE